MVRIKILLLIILVSLTGIPTMCQSVLTFNAYHTPGEVQRILERIEQSNPGKIKLHRIATTPGGKPVAVLEIGNNLKDVPAIFVGANFEGNIPLATEGALKLAKMLLDSSQYTAAKKWYILPLPNPDAAEGFFAEVKYDRTINDFVINNDVDNASGEDGPDDLNGDGWITQMRVKDMEGTYIQSAEDPKFMVEADKKEGERGVYKIYTEGIDNDNDGKYNEDGEGGINVGIAFPHLFPEYKKEAGLWPGQTPEVYHILRFIFDRPEIAMVYTLGSSNFCLVPPKGGRKGDPDLKNIKLSSRYARAFGVEAKTYPMEEVIEMVKDLVPAGTEVTTSTVASMLGLGAAVNPLEDDLKFYTDLSEEYKSYLKNQNFNLERLDPEPAKNGSFELWAYYHLGLPSFSMRLFSVPKIKEESGEKADTNEKEEQKDANKNDKKESLEKEKALFAWSEKEWKGKGFVDWQKVEHPEFDEVEVGGFVPYIATTPQPERIDSLLNVQLPWLLQLSEKLPEISFSDEKVTDLGAGVYKLELYIENKGYLPYPISMGERNQQPAPVIILLEGNVQMLEGIQRTPLRKIGGNQVKKLTWLLKAGKSTEITAKIQSAMFGTKVKQIKIGG